MDIEKDQFDAWQQKQLEAWESLCGRCGACCGLAEGDPCEHLVQDSLGKYQCNVYANRFGIRRSISGREFKCVPIRDILHLSWIGDQCCGYKKDNVRRSFPSVQ